jgi:hypothetical protein
VNLASSEQHQGGIVDEEETGPGESEQQPNPRKTFSFLLVLKSLLFTCHLLISCFIVLIAEIEDVKEGSDFWNRCWWWQPAPQNVVMQGVKRMKVDGLKEAFKPDIHVTKR